MFYPIINYIFNKPKSIFFVEQIFYKFVFEKMPRAQFFDFEVDNVNQSSLKKLLKINV